MICESVPMEEENEGARYRYWLHRAIAPLDRKGLVFVLLNPSTAIATIDDPTIRRCMGFAAAWGYRELTVVNLFAIRATKPKDLIQAETRAIGPKNQAAIQWACQAGRMVMAAWGNHGSHLERSTAVLDIIPKPHALRMTTKGQPAHPLYLPKDLKPRRMRRPDGSESSTYFPFQL